MATDRRWASNARGNRSQLAAAKLPGPGAALRGSGSQPTPGPLVLRPDVAVCSTCEKPAAASVSAGSSRTPSGAVSGGC